MAERIAGPWSTFQQNLEPPGCPRDAALISFKADRYPDRKGPEYWTEFTYPFQFTDLLTALDSLSKLGVEASDPDIARAVDWFRDRQRPDGSMALDMCRGIGDKRLPCWLGLALGRTLPRLQRARGRVRP